MSKPKDRLAFAPYRSEKLFGICIKCVKTAYYNCGGCSDFYCSEECKSSDLWNHRQFCFSRPLFGICIKCGKTASYKCGRCSDFYCSEECKSCDWWNHRPFCFPMPKLVPTKWEDLNSLGNKNKVNDSAIPVADGEHSNISPSGHTIFEEII